MHKLLLLPDIQKSVCAAAAVAARYVHRTKKHTSSFMHTHRAATTKCNRSSSRSSSSNIACTVVCIKFEKLFAVLLLCEVVVVAAAVIFNKSVSETHTLILMIL